MIRSLTLENYRGFRRFSMHGLGRVNLIVGTNNAGKTSVLEAIQIVESPSELGPIWATLTRRGEDTEERDVQNTKREVDIRRLFHGHEIRIGNTLVIEAATDSGKDHFSAFFAEPKPNPDDHPTLDITFETTPYDRPASLGLHWIHGQANDDTSIILELTGRGGLSFDSVRRMSRRETKRIPNRLITAGSLSPEAVIDMFEEVVLTPAEDFVIDALRVIEPSIERIATSGTERRKTVGTRLSVRGGLLVRCEGIRDRIPIGSMGDGIWRMLGLALALARTEGGILLVDEIDTGLHYSVMEKMWRLVSQTAERLRIQVFATTHSRDCYESLAAISHNVGPQESQITMQRVERGKEQAVAYSEREIIAAAKRHLEVR